MKRRTMPVKHAELICRTDMAITRQIEKEAHRAANARMDGNAEGASFHHACAMKMAEILGLLEERQFPGDEDMQMNMLENDSL